MFCNFTYTYYIALRVSCASRCDLLCTLVFYTPYSFVFFFFFEIIPYFLLLFIVTKTSLFRDKRWNLARGKRFVNHRWLIFNRCFILEPTPPVSCVSERNFFAVHRLRLYIFIFIQVDFKYIRSYHRRNPRIKFSMYLQVRNLRWTNRRHV